MEVNNKMLFNGTTDDHVHMMDWWFDVFGPYYWIFMVLGWVIYFIIGIILAYYVHKDAIRRNVRNSEFWLVIVLIFNIVGAILYLLVRSNYNQTNYENKTEFKKNS